MPDIARAPAAPDDAAQAAKILRAKTPLTKDDWTRLDDEGRKRAITVAGEVDVDVIRSMRDALARAKRDGVPYKEFVKTAGKDVGAQWGIDSPHLRTVFVNNIQSAVNAARYAAQMTSSVRRSRPYWTLRVVDDETTSSTCRYFITHPVVLPAGHPWWSTNYPPRHHRCRSVVDAITAAEAKKIGITAKPPDWPADKGWGKAAPLGTYKPTLNDSRTITVQTTNDVRAVLLADKYAHIDFKPPKGAREEARRGLEWRRKHGRGGTAVGVARARDLANGATLSPSTVRRMKAFFDRHQNGAGKGSKPGEQGFPSPWRIAWALWGGDAGYSWSRKVVEQMNAADRKAKTMRDRAVNNDLGQGDVHTDGIVRVPPKGKKTMGEISTKQRKGLSKQQFALPETRQYPIHDAAHARNAMARLEQNKGRLSPAEYATAKRNILKAYKKFGIEHKGEPVKNRAAMGSSPTRGFRLRIVHGNRRYDIMHASDNIGADDAVLCGDVEIDPLLLGDGPGKLVWNQLAKVGQFAGHPSGPFKLTPVEFEQIVRNFKATQNRKISIDFEHASEQDPTSGNIPTEGAPAQGWIHDLQNRGAEGLWGLVEWLEPARTYIREKRYRFFSPAIRFGAKDRVTGEPIGARMTSGALTNNPFLDGMAPLAASDRAATDAAQGQANMSDYCYSAAEVMPRIRMGLYAIGTPQYEMATAAECMEQMCRLEDTYEQCLAAGCDPMGDHMGVALGARLKQLRDAMQMGMGMTWPDLFALIKEMIQSAIGGSPDADEEDIPPSSAGMRAEMSDKELEIKLRDAETKASTLEAKAAALELQLNDRTAKLTALESEIAALRDEADKRRLADETSAVETAFATYKDSHRLTDAHKKQMLLTYRSDPSLFATLYPPVAPDQRHLQRTLSARQSPGAATSGQQSGVPPMAAPPAFMMSQNAWMGGNVGMQAAPMDKRGYAERLYSLAEQKVKGGMSREQANVEARRELNTVQNHT